MTPYDNPAVDADAPTSEPEFVAAWLEAIEAAGAEEKAWTQDADKAVKAYRGDDAAAADFNIYHANIETIVPALYNSTPAPDVRRRYNDEDPVGKAVADVIERALQYSIDACDFDGLMGAAVWDMAVTGRGLARVRYAPLFAPDGRVAFEQVSGEYVPWRSFRRGPGRLWSDVTWIAFEHFLSRDEIAQKAPDLVGEVPFTYSASAKDGRDAERAAAPRFGKRAHAWEIWDRDERQVYFICPDYGRRRLWSVADPLGLENFFPVPRPMQALASTDSLVPISSYAIYENLILELNEISRRIKKLVKQLRPRGGYAGVSLDLKAIAEADDGELVPLTGAEMFTASGGAGLEKAITWFPLEPTVAALQQLVAQREMVKQTIYEVTKIADVMRGATSPEETFGAQQLKSQWGSLSVQRMQQEVVRFARDLFRLKAEIIAAKFSMGTLALMTGLKFPTAREQAAAQARVDAAMRRQVAAPPMPSAPPMGAAPTGAPPAVMLAQADIQ